MKTAPLYSPLPCERLPCGVETARADRASRHCSRDDAIGKGASIRASEVSAECAGSVLRAVPAENSLNCKWKYDKSTKVSINSTNLL